MRQSAYRTPVKQYIPGPVCPTRFRELAYQHRGDHWRILDMTGGGESGIGPQYPTRRELLADLERFAKDFGC